MSNSIKEMYQLGIEAKAFAIIESIQNYEQIKVAEKYVELFNNMFKDKDSYGQLTTAIEDKKNYFNGKG